MSDDAGQFFLDPEILEALQDELGKDGKKVCLAEDNLSRALSPYIGKILKAMRIEAFVTDETYMGDFNGAQPLGVGFPAWLARLGEELGVELTPKTRIVDAAVALAKKGEVSS